MKKKIYSINYIKTRYEQEQGDSISISKRIYDDDE